MQQTDIHFDHISLFFLEWEMFKQKLYTKSKQPFYVQQPFSENRTVYEIMWKNCVQSGRPQISKWCMHIVYWIPKATNTYFYLFHCYNGRTNAPQCYVPVRCLSCLRYVSAVASKTPALRRLSVQHCTHIATDLSGTSSNVTTDVAACKSSFFYRSQPCCVGILSAHLYFVIVRYVRFFECSVVLMRGVGNGRRRM
jgi:hypothetical protein